MEKLFGGFSAIVMGWMSFMQKDKVSKSTCKAIHDGLCQKLDMMSEDLRLIKEHLMGEK